MQPINCLALLETQCVYLTYVMIVWDHKYVASQKQFSSEEKFSVTISSAAAAVLTTALLALFRIIIVAVVL